MIDILYPDFHSSSFYSTQNNLKITYHGIPPPFKRVGWFVCFGCRRAYNANSRKQRQFTDAMTLIHEVCDIDLIQFSTREAEVQLVFYIKRQHEPDVDNLVKFVLDCLQKEVTVNGQVGRILDDDKYVMKIVAEKRFILPGQRPSTSLQILPLVVKIDF